MNSQDVFLPKTSSCDSGSAATAATGATGATGAAASAVGAALGSGEEAFNRRTKTDLRGEALRYHGNRTKNETATERMSERDSYSNLGY